VTQHRGEPVDSELAPVVIATVHPSSILRADDREAEFAAFVSDLKTVSAHI
jgi:uracil-DNA glycosylase